MLCGLRHRRRDGEVVAGVYGDGLIDDSKVSVEMLELSAHPVKASFDAALLGTRIGRIKEAIERRFN